MVADKSLSPATIFGSVLEKNEIYMMSNRMRNLHMHLSKEYGKENVKIFC